MALSLTQVLNPHKARCDGPVTRHPPTLTLILTLNPTLTLPGAVRRPRRGAAEGGDGADGGRPRRERRLLGPPSRRAGAVTRDVF